MFRKTIQKFKLGFIFLVCALLVPRLIQAATVTVNCSGTSGAPTAVTEADLTGDDVTFADAGGDGYCVLDNPITPASVLVEAGVTITHTATDTDGITITATGDVTIESGASLNASAKGYAGGLNENADGTGTGHGHKAPDTNLSGGGAGHGGAGGNGHGEGGITYDDEDNPTDLGSGGGAGYGVEEEVFDISGGAGGGLILITASTLTINGTLQADGEDGHPRGDWCGGGGSGGSINIIADTIDGDTGFISAIGGDATGWGGGGGGGRIAITGADATSFLDDFSTANSLRGGTAVNMTAGTVGTLYTYLVPATPSISSPLNGSYNVGQNPTLTSSSYISSGTHVSSDWKISTDTNGSNIVWSKNADTVNKTTIVVNTTNGTFAGTLAGATTLTNGETYYAFVRHTNATDDSSWSATGHSFTVSSGVTATTYSWDFSNAAAFTFDDSLIGVSDGVASLIDQGGDTYRSVLAEYPYRKTLYIQNAGAVLTNYQITFAVAYDANMQADFDDLRFVAANDGTTELSYWIETKTNSVSATVWVKVPTIAASGTTTLYMYYGNASATAASSKDNTMKRDYSDDSNLVLQWLMDEGVGLAVEDSSGNNNDGVLQSDGTGGWWGTDNYFLTGDSINFDGTGIDAITSSVAIDTTLTNDFTLETWFYMDDDGSNWGEFFHQTAGDNFIVQKQTGNRELIVVFTGMGEEWAIQGMAEGAWNHIVVTHDKSEANAFKVYINGALARTSNFQGLSPSSTGNLRVGNDLAGAVVDGKMDEIRVYTRHMTQNEVSAHYTHHKYAATEPSIVWGDESSTTLENWTKRKEYAVINNTASELTNFQVQFSIPYDADMQTDFDDIRLTAANGTTLLDYWVESKTDSDSATVWVEIPTIPASSLAMVYLYYGNAGASSASNIANTMVFGDDFSSALDTEKWTTSGAPTIDSGSLILNAENEGVWSTSSTMPNNTIVETRFKTSNVHMVGRTAVTNSASKFHWEVAWGADFGFEYLIWDNAYFTQSVAGGERTSTVIGDPVDTSWHEYKFVYTDGTSIGNYFDGVLKFTHTSNIPQVTANIGYEIFLGGDGDGTIMEADWIFARKYTTTEPTVTEAGAEEDVSLSDVGLSTNSGVPYVELFTFTETLGGENEGSVKYQISNNGTDWYYHEGDAWVEITENAATYDTAATVNAYLPDFIDDVGLGDFYIRAFLISNGVQEVELDQIDLTYTPITVDFNTATQVVAEDVGTVTVTASLNNAYAQAITVPFTVTGTATGSGTDHNLANGNITITAGQLSGSTTFTVTDDAIDDNDETIIITMGTPTYAVAGATTVLTITITDNDESGGDTPAPPSGSFDNVAIAAGSSFHVVEEHTGTLTATVTNPDSLTLTYAWSQISGTTVTINNSTTLSASFTAPTAPATLVFCVQATDGTHTTSCTGSALVTANVISQIMDLDDYPGSSEYIPGQVRSLVEDGTSRSRQLAALGTLIYETETSYNGETRHAIQVGETQILTCSGESVPLVVWDSLVAIGDPACIDNRGLAISIDTTSLSDSWIDLEDTQTLAHLDVLKGHSSGDLLGTSLALFVNDENQPSLAITAPGSSYGNVYLANLTDNLSLTSMLVGAPSERLKTEQVFMTDLNNDDSFDLVVGITTNTSVSETASLYAGFSPLSTTTNLAEDAATFDLSTSANMDLADCGDLNADTYDDCVLGSREDGVLSLIYGTSDLSAIDVNDEIDSSHNLRSLAMGDVSGDGVDDLILGIADDDNGAVYVMLGQSGLEALDWTLDDAIVLSGNDGEGLGESLIIVDYDGDSRLDVLAGLANEENETRAINVAGILSGEPGTWRGLTSSTQQSGHSSGGCSLNTTQDL